MYSITHEWSGFAWLGILCPEHLKGNIFLMPNFIGHNWPIKKQRSKHLCVPSGGIMSATYSSLKSFNTPLGSIHGQTDIAITFLCSSKYLWTLDQQRTPNVLVIIESNRFIWKSGEPGIQLFIWFFNTIFQLLYGSYWGNSNSGMCNWY